MRRLLIAAAAVFMISTFAIISVSKEGKQAGKIMSVSAGSKEIVINIESGKTVSLGEKLYVRSDGKVVMLEATFPMQTTSKCRLLKNSSKYAGKIKPGMNVYFYDKSITDEKAVSDEMADTADKKIADEITTEEATTGKVMKAGGIELAYIQSGTYKMGSPSGERFGSKYEKPHRVTLSSFWIGKYEVTQKQYKTVMGSNPSEFKGDRLPVENISWFDAVQFCNRLSEKYKLKPYYNIEKNSPENIKSNSDKFKVTILGGNGFRLPTEAEWEYACRAGTTTAYHYGDQIDSTMANIMSVKGKTTEVGSYPPNAWGLYDMHGNVTEWCGDWYNADYYADSPEKNPQGPEKGEARAMRGGSWRSDPGDVRSAKIYGNFPGNFVNFDGFRIAKSAD